MSEQPIQLNYESVDKGVLFDDGNVVDFKKATPGLKSYAEVQAARMAEQAAREAAMKHSFEHAPHELTVADARLALSNLNRVRETYLEKKAA